MALKYFKYQNKNDKTVQEMTRGVRVREYKNVEPGESSSSSGGLTPVEPDEP